MPAAHVGGMINVCPYLASLPAICYVAYGRVASLKYTLAHRERYFCTRIHSCLLSSLYQRRMKSYRKEEIIEIKLF